MEKFRLRKSHKTATGRWAYALLYGQFELDFIEGYQEATRRLKQVKKDMGDAAGDNLVTLKEYNHLYKRH